MIVTCHVSWNICKIWVNLILSENGQAIEFAALPNLNLQYSDL